MNTVTQVLAKQQHHSLVWQAAIVGTDVNVGSYCARLWPSWLGLAIGHCLAV